MTSGRWVGMLLGHVAGVTLAAALVAACGTQQTPPAIRSACEAQGSAMTGHSVSIWLRVRPATDEQHRFREYRLHIPDGYTPSTRTPLVLYFHGAGGTAAQADRDSGWSSLADRDHFLVAYPQALAFGGDLRGRHVKRGGMAGYLACAMARTISAAAPVAANNYVLSKLGCRPTRPVSILEVHGTADQVVPYYGTSARISPQWPLPSIHAWVSSWAHLDHCISRPTVNKAHPDTIFRYRRCVTGTDVILYRIDGGTHNYPRELAGS